MSWRRVYYSSLPGPSASVPIGVAARPRPSDLGGPKRYYSHVFSHGLYGTNGRPQMAEIAWCGSFLYPAADDTKVGRVGVRLAHSQGCQAVAVGLSSPSSRRRTDRRSGGMFRKVPTRTRRICDRMAMQLLDVPSTLKPIHVKIPLSLYIRHVSRSKSE